MGLQLELLVAVVHAEAATSRLSRAQHQLDGLQAQLSQLSAEHLAMAKLYSELQVELSAV